MKAFKKWLGGVDKKKKPNNDDDTQSFENSLATKNIIDNLVEHVPIISNLSYELREHLICKLRPEKFAKGAYIMEQGKAGDKFYTIIKGHADVIVKNKAKKDDEGSMVAQLTTGDYFGEQALIQADGVRNATIVCTTDCQCLSLTRSHFMLTVGDKYKDMFKRRVEKRIAVQDEIVEDNVVNWDDPKFKKSEETAKWLIGCIKDVGLFEGLDDDQLKTSVRYMHEQKVAKAESLIKQGDDGKTFYVIFNGSLDVSVKGKGVVKKLAKGDTTGELALMYDAPRAASVTATTASSVYVLERGLWRKALQRDHKNESNANTEFLKKVKMFASLLSGERELISQALNSRTYEKGFAIITEGAYGTEFFILKSGRASGIKDGAKIVIKPGDYFGERALLMDEGRAMTITSETICEVLYLSREDFDDLLGPLNSLMGRNIEDYKKPQGLADEVPKEHELIVGQEITSYTSLGVLGAGAFGVVTLLQDRSKDSQPTFALKAISKTLVNQNKQATHVISEKNLMAKMNCPFLVNLRGYYHDKCYVFLLLELCLGGELFGLLQEQNGFSEEWAKFFAGCVVEGFHYMHSLDIIFRDLKPENIVIDTTGYLKITDFGFAKVVKDNTKTFTLCGTPDYLCPEVITGAGHGKGLDWWTLGVLIFEMVAAHPPFEASAPTESYRKIMKVRYRCPKWFSMPVIDIIKCFLIKKPVKRLGMKQGRTKNIRRHSWFNAFNWSALQKRTLEPPYTPKLANSIDVSNFHDSAAASKKLKYTDMSGQDTDWADKEYGPICTRAVAKK